MVRVSFIFSVGVRVRVRITFGGLARVSIGGRFRVRAMANVRYRITVKLCFGLC